MVAVSLAIKPNDPSKIGRDAIKYHGGLFGFVSPIQPLYRIEVVFTIIAGIGTALAPMTHRDNIFGRCSGVIRARIGNRYPVFTSNSIPLVCAPAANTAAVVPVLNTPFPVLHSVSKWQIIGTTAPFHFIAVEHFFIVRCVTALLFSHFARVRKSIYSSFTKNVVFVFSIITKAILPSKVLIGSLVGFVITNTSLAPSISRKIVHRFNSFAPIAISHSVREFTSKTRHIATLDSIAIFAPIEKSIRLGLFLIKVKNRQFSFTHRAKFNAVFCDICNSNLSAPFTPNFGCVIAFALLTPTSDTSIDTAGIGAKFCVWFICFASTALMFTHTRISTTPAHHSVRGLVTSILLRERAINLVNYFRDGALHERAVHGKHHDPSDLLSTVAQSGDTVELHHVVDRLSVRHKKLKFINGKSAKWLGGFGWTFRFDYSDARRTFAHLLTRLRCALGGFSSLLDLPRLDLPRDVSDVRLMVRPGELVSALREYAHVNSAACVDNHLFGLTRSFNERVITNGIVEDGVVAAVHFDTALRPAMAADSQRLRGVSLPTLEYLTYAGVVTDHAASKSGATGVESIVMGRKLLLGDYRLLFESGAVVAAFVQYIYITRSRVNCQALIQLELAVLARPSRFLPVVTTSHKGIQRTALDHIILSDKLGGNFPRADQTAHGRYFVSCKFCGLCNCQQFSLSLLIHRLSLNPILRDFVQFVNDLHDLVYNNDVTYSHFGRLCHV